MIFHIFFNFLQNKRKYSWFEKIEGEYDSSLNFTNFNLNEKFLDSRYQNLNKPNEQKTVNFQTFEFSKHEIRLYHII